MYLLSYSSVDAFRRSNQPLYYKVSTKDPLYSTTSRHDQDDLLNRDELWRTDPHHRLELQRHMAGLV